MQKLLLLLLMMTMSMITFSPGGSKNAEVNYKIRLVVNSTQATLVGRHQ